MKSLSLCFLPLAFSLLVSANPPPPPPAITLTPTVMIVIKTPTPVMTKPTPVHKLRYTYWLPWMSVP